MASYSAIISNASEYVKTGLIDHWKRWIVLIILSLIQMFTINIIPLVSGYLVRVYAQPDDMAPEIDEYGKLFVDGWKMNIVTILYMIPAIIIALAFGAVGVISALAGLFAEGKMTHIGGLMVGSIGLFLAFLVFLLITLVMNMAYVHFSRSGRLLDAFSIGEITRNISDGIGWGSYIVMWIIVWLLTTVFFFIISGLTMIPILGWLALLALTPLWSVFLAKINGNVYYNRP
ncbi:DUF4013 domain-containing protein [Methanospirillum sp. J.3.6.1-F.2.7.3]|jgi:hypothetical protein|uniref:DUF4013 domain-containing protein n=2 Tax=Methanospirillum TaxID=2202 RepID=A0A8E7EL23_9EURY|nr:MULTISPECIES: DUF4013 domain-containing protein [Methanospirillum]MDX8550869.1 DUF4013 domain-containing protein [Methanospirillum hungatei]NLW75757.1 DUF4013 domain-containing protein [Methanomicrobiales archaeon]QVV90165.1 DUF4013 domain-containing protein [Methanospirillum sp. J.3.6.1-F.2.7.3]QXO94552.1 DUF4013 domain-containing protein [Methanospirillum hungatei]